MKKNKSKKLTEMSLDELWHLFPISLTAHKNSWTNQYQEMKDIIISKLSNVKIIRISHVGSTAIQNIMAKNIVDILLEVDLSESLSNIASKIIEIGFIKMSSSITRYSFNYGYTEKGFADKVFHLHLRYQGDNDELYFRDYLIDHPVCAKEYESLKLSLWKKYEFDRDAYTNAKTEFVKKYTNIAKVEYVNRYQ